MAARVGMRLKHLPLVGAAKISCQFFCAQSIIDQSDPAQFDFFLVWDGSLGTYK